MILNRYRNWERQSRWGLPGAALGGLVALPVAAATHLASSAELSGWLLFLVALLAAIYGNLRYGWSNPFSNSAYGLWLSQTPWVRGKQLPLGSPYFHLNDLTFMLVLALAFHEQYLLALTLLAIAFVAGYVTRGSLMASIYGERVLSWGIVGAFGIIIAFSFSNGEFRLAPLLVATCVVALCSQLSVRSMLSRFHQISITPQAKKLTASTTLAARSQYGSPWAELLTDLEDEEVGTMEALLSLVPIAYLLGCCELARSRAVAWAGTMDNESILDLPDTASGKIAEMIYFFVQLSGEGHVVPFVILTPPILAAVFLAPLAVLSTQNGYATPISLLGRFATGQILIPRYDVVWLAPVTGCIAYSAVASVCCFFLPLSITILVGAISGFAWYAHWMPSSLEWRLLGHHRIACGPVPVRKR